MANQVVSIEKDGIKTILVHPSNKDLESYYEEFNFKIIPKVIRNINTQQYYENHNEGRIMYLEL